MLSSPVLRPFPSASPSDSPLPSSLSSGLEIVPPLSPGIESPISPEFSRSAGTQSRTESDRALTEQDEALTDFTSPHPELINGNQVSKFVPLLKYPSLHLFRVLPDQWDASDFAGESLGKDENFGAVLVGGNFNGDGYAELGIGIPLKDLGASGLGAEGQVNILQGSFTGLTNAGSQTWNQNDIPGNVANQLEGFGSTLAAADFNGDGYDDLLAGVMLEVIQPGHLGMVHSLYGSSSGLTATGSQSFTQSTLPTGGNTPFKWFGSALETGDFDNDGFDDAVINIALKPDPNKSATGAVNILHGSASGLTTSGSQLWSQNDLQGGGSPAGDGFGHSLTVGDFDGDGYDDLASSAPYEDLGGVKNAGSVYALYGSNTGLTATGNQRFTQPDLPGGTNESHDNFGEVLAAGDFNGDGYDELAIGTPRKVVSNPTTKGSIDILQGSASGLTPTGHQQWTRDNFTGMPLTTSSSFGRALAVGDFDGDGYDDLVANSSRQFLLNPGVWIGELTAIYGSSKGLTTAGHQTWNQATLGEFNEKGDFFGHTLGVSDFNGDGYDDLAIGAKGETLSGVAEAGVVHVVYGSHNGLVI